MPPITPVSTIPHPATISEALRELDVSEPWYLDSLRWARVAGEVIPLPPVGSLRMRIQADASVLEAAIADAAAKLEQFAQVVVAEAATSLESEDDAE